MNARRRLRVLERRRPSPVGVDLRGPEWARGGGGGGATDAFGKRLNVCVWVLATVCLQRGAICVGERCVFVFAGGEGLCVCVFVFEECGGGRERWPGCHSAIRLTGAPSSGPGSSDCRFEETK